MDFNWYIKLKNKSRDLIYGVDWGINQFPDGQNQFWYEEEVGFFNCEIRICNPSLLDVAIQIADSTYIREFSILYVYGARCDKQEAETRRVSDVGPMYLGLLKNKLGYGQLQTLDIHFNPHLVDFTFKNTEISWLHVIKENKIEALLFPDASAGQRYQWVKSIDLPKYHCSKERDQITGKIIKHTYPEIKEDNILVVDDICDGGRTFVDLLNNYNKKLHLAITHGIFSNGALEKLRGFKTINCTDSYQKLEGYQLSNLKVTRL